MKGLTSLGNMTIEMLANLAIQGVETWIYDMITAQEQAIEKGEKSRVKIKEIGDSYKQTSTTIIDLGQHFFKTEKTITSTGDAISSIAQKYTTLVRGVNDFTNANKNLNPNDYKEYLEISNQLGNLFPSLIVGYDAQNNAILNLGRGTESTTQQLENLLTLQRHSANAEIGNGLQDVYDGTLAQDKQYQTKIFNAHNQIDVAQKYQKSLATSNSGFDNISDRFIVGDVTYISKVQEKLKELDTVDFKVEYIDSDSQYFDKSRPDTAQQQLTLGPLVTAEKVKNLQSLMTDSGEKTAKDVGIEIDNLEKTISILELKQQDNLKSINAEIGAWLSTKDSVAAFDFTLQDALINNLGKAINHDLIENKYDNDIEDYLYQEFITPLSTIDQKSQKEIGKLLNLDTNLGNYKEKVKDTFADIFPDDQKHQKDLMSKFGFNEKISSLSKKSNELQKKFSSNKADIDKISTSDLEIAYSLILEEDFNENSFDKLLKRIHEVKNATEEFSTSSNKMFDAINEADQTPNAGSDYKQARKYLDEAKALYDAKEIGTDDFKTRAAYFSPTGSDDEVNFAENLSRAERYLTEDKSGAEAFLSDLSSKGYATMTTLADGTDKWSFSMNDLADSANEMGMGFEFFMDMFGRLNDLGISNNFIDNQEDGVNHLSELYTQLAQEEEKLSELTADGDYETTEGNTFGNQTAIDAARSKIEGLKADIEETLGYMDLLVNKNAEDYDSEVTAAKDTIEALAEQRQNVLDEGGKNSSSIAAMYEDQIRALAEKYHISLNLDLTSADDSDLQSQIEEKRAELAELTESLKGPLSESGTAEVQSKIAQARQELVQLIDAKNQLNEPQLMSVDASSMGEGIQEAVSLLQLYYSQSQALEAMKIQNPDVDTSQAESSLQILREQILGLPENVKIALSIDQLSGEQILPAIQNQTITIPKTTTEVETGEVQDSTVKNYSPKNKLIPVSTGPLNTSSLNIPLPPKYQTVFLNPVTASAMGPLSGNSSTTPQNGTNNAFGTVGTSFANGNWSVNTPGRSLVGELGREIVVRNGQFFTVGDTGAEFRNLHKGDIVFNHKQSELLLNRGFLSSRGKMIGGNAFAQGSGSTQAFNGIERLLKNFTNKVKSIAAQITDFIAFSTKTSLLKKQLTATVKEEKANTKAAGKYQKKMKSVKMVDDNGKSYGKLSNAWKKKIESGNYSIKDINTSSDKGKALANAVSKYQEYYDAMTDCKTAAQELKNEQLELYEQIVNVPIEEAEKKIDRLTAKIKNLKSAYSVFSSGGSAIANYGTEINKQQKDDIAKAKKEEDSAKRKKDSTTKKRQNAGNKLLNQKKKLSNNQKKAVTSGEKVSTKGLKGKALRTAKAYNKKVTAEKTATKNHKTAKANTKAASASLTDAQEIAKKYANSPSYEGQNALLDTELKETKNINTENQKALQKANKNVTTAKNASDKAKSAKNKKAKSIRNNKNYAKHLNADQKNALKKGEKVSTKGIKDKKTLAAINAYNKQVTAAKTAADKLKIAQEAQMTAADNAAQSQAEYAEAISETVKEQLKNTQAFYQSKKAFEDSEQSLAKSQAKKKQAEGKDLTKADYNKQIDAIKKQKETLLAEQANLQSQLDAAVKNETIKKFSEEWYEWQANINKVAAEVDNCDEEIHDLADTMRNDVDLRVFERMLQNLDSAAKKIGVLRNLINDDMMFGDDGKMTDFGVAALSLDIDNMKNAQVELQTLLDKRKRLEELRAQHPNYSQQEYDKEMIAISDEITSALSGVDSARKSVLDTIKQTAKAELDAITKTIDARKELLQKKKDYYDYDKTLKNKSKEVQLLQQQITALNGVTDAESRAKKARLEAQLAEAQEDMDETIRDHTYEIQLEGLDNLKTELQEDYDNYVKNLSRNLDLITETIDAATKTVTGAVGKTKEVIEEILNRYGVKGLDENDLSHDTSVPGYANGGLVKAVKRNNDDILASLKDGEYVLNTEMTDLAFKALPFLNSMAENWEQNYLKVPNMSSGIPVLNHTMAPDVTIDNSITIEGHADKDLMPDLQRFQHETVQKTMTTLRKEMVKAGASKW